MLKQSSEPDLGLGFIESQDERTITAFFPSSEASRTYIKKNAPLQRVSFQVGDQIESRDGLKLTIDDIEEEEGLLIYFQGDQFIIESQLKSNISFDQAGQKLLSGNLESLQAYQLRQQALQLQEKIDASATHGFLGPRIQRLPHQLYVAQEATKNIYPRILLADEVGLGKTIEAGLIMHHLWVTERAKRILVLTPDALCVQWFVEMYRKFNLSFRIHSTAHMEEEDTFEDQALHLVGFDLVKDKAEVRASLEKQNWDLLLVDEAHRLNQNRQNLEVFDWVSEMALKIPSLIMLSATPEQFGMQGHFERLSLLDPDRFLSFEQFLKEHESYEKLSELIELLEKEKCSKAEQSRKENLLDVYFQASEIKDKSPQDIVTLLIDQFGTGRVMFRNTRKHLKEHNIKFPKRMCHGNPIDGNGQADALSNKVQWLIELLLAHSDSKYLWICHDLKTLKKVEKKLKGIEELKIASFHEELSLSERDRNAAYFSEADGAQILLCSEMGTEGRNFQFAQQLILFDLPLFPDLIEQRIGRLDRLGQEKNISIHVPYLKNSHEAFAFRWYHEGLGAFEQTAIGSGQVKEKLEADLESFMEGDYDAKKANALVEQTQVLYSEIRENLKTGRDVLLEKQSYRNETAHKLKQSIEANEHTEDIAKLLSYCFEYFGLEEEALNDRATIVSEGTHMKLDRFPGFHDEKMSITFDHDLALHREDIHYITSEHPMLTGSLDMIISQQLGNCSLATWSQSVKDAPVIECVFRSQCSAPRQFNPKKFIPSRCYRILLDGKGQEVGESWPQEKLYAALKPARGEHKLQLRQLSKDHLDAFVDTCKKPAQKLFQKDQQQDKTRLDKGILPEIERLEQLQKKNPWIRNADIEALKQQHAVLSQELQDSQLQLDSILMIFP